MRASVCMQYCYSKLPQVYLYALALGTQSEAQTKSLVEPIGFLPNTNNAFLSVKTSSSIGPS